MKELDGLSLTYQFLKIDEADKPYLEDIEKVLWEKSNPLFGQKPHF